MKAKDYPSFLAIAQRHAEQERIDYDNSTAKVNQIILKETRGAYMWRNNPFAQIHTWDFYLDELDWS